MNLPDGYFLKRKKYQLTNSIGQGGFGITYLGVWNTEVKGELGAMKTKVPVCIKEYFFKDYCYRDKDSYAVKVHSETGEKLFGKFKEKLIKEANILSAVHHPHIVNVLEVFEENNTAYIIMEYIKGCSLKYMLEKEGVLSENKVLKYTHQIGNALDFVHDNNIVHLDIKPGNILIDRDDNARLIDFGVSKRYDIEEQETSTTTLTLSKGFASIEQYDDEGMQNFSPHPDIYSLGATIYNLLTGVIPVESILRATKKMLPPTAFNSNISAKTEKAILKAMEVKPEDRFHKVKELLAEIDIPPYEFTENTLIETKQVVVDDSTEVIGTNSSGSTTMEDDNDRTILTSSHKSNYKKRYAGRDKTKRVVLLSTSVLLCAFIGYVVYDFFSDTISFRSMYRGVGLSGDSLNQGSNADDGLFNVSRSSSNAQNQTQVQQETQQPSVQNSTDDQSPANNSQPQTKTQNSETASVKPATSSSKENTKLTANNSGSTKTGNTAYEKEYQNLISSAKNKMDIGNYSGAREDLSKAQDIIIKTEMKSLFEVERLFQTCTDKEEEQNKKDRLSNYDIFYPFGTLKVARNKKTKLYGAIDADGKERIPCQYITTNQNSNDTPPEFLRKDNLVDIYNEDGRLVGAGVRRTDY